MKVDLIGAWATLVLGQAKKATRTKGTRHDAVSDTSRVKRRKGISLEMVIRRVGLRVFLTTVAIDCTSR